MLRTNNYTEKGAEVGHIGILNQEHIQQGENESILINRDITY